MTIKKSSANYDSLQNHIFEMILHDMSVNEQYKNYKLS